MFFVSEEYLRKYKESGEIGGSTLSDATTPGESLFPAEKGGEHVAKSKRGSKGKG